MLHHSAEEVLEHSPTPVWSNIELHDFEWDFGVFLQWILSTPYPTNMHVPSYESNLIITTS